MRRSGKEERHVAKGELIGLKTRVVASGDPTLVGLEGEVVDETRNTFRLARSDGREVVVPKRGQTFRFASEAETFELSGSTITHAPEDRTKKAR